VTNKKDSKIRQIINMILASLFLIKKEDRKKVLDEVKNIGTIADAVEAEINAIGLPVNPPKKKRATRKKKPAAPPEQPSEPTTTPGA